MWGTEVGGHAPAHVLAARLLVISCLLSCSTAIALTDEPVPIGDVVADPDGYHLELVTLRGTVRRVKAIAPYSQNSGVECYGAYSFTLEDDTGVITVAVLGLCGKPMIKEPDVSDGETVTVRAQIYAPGHFGSFREPDGRPLGETDQDQVQAVANQIVHEGQ